jgi:hypothetical protein
MLSVAVYLRASNGLNQALYARYFQSFIHHRQGRAGSRHQER